jgi:serine/threonine-protein kinase PRP4
LGIKPTNKIDIWSLGCTLFELYTGKILFEGRNNNEMIKLFMKYNGCLNMKLLKKGELTHLYFTEDYNYFKSYENGTITNIDVYKIKSNDLSNIIMQHCKEKGDNEIKVKQFINLVEMCLNIDPFKRTSALDAYSHPFLWE